MILFKNLSTYFRKTEFILICVTSILIFVSLISSYINTSSKSILEANNEKSDNYVNFSLGEEENIDPINVINELKKQDNIIIRHSYGLNFDPGTMSEGIYFNDQFTNGYDLLSGRFFDTNDFESNKKIAIIGKQVLDKTKIIQGKRYIQRGTENFEVIGIMGKKDISTRYDYLVLYNLNCELSENEPILGENWILDSTTKSESNLLDIINNINNKHNNKTIEIQTRQEQPNPLNEAFKNSNYLVINYSFVIACIFLSLLKSILYWIESLKLEIGIRKAFGAKNVDIVIYILKKYIAISFISCVIALSIQKILLLIKVIAVDNYEIGYINMLTTISFAFILGIVVIFIAINKINRIEPNELLKGN